MDQANGDGVVVRESPEAGPYGQVVIAGHHVLGADEPEAAGGHDTGLSPYQYVMAGLGACTSMTIRMYAQRHAWPVGRISVAVWHERLPPSGSPVRDRFLRRIRIEGELTPEQRKHLMEIADRCPVSTTLSHGAEVVSVQEA